MGEGFSSAGLSVYEFSQRASLPGKCENLIKSKSLHQCIDQSSHVSEFVTKFKFLCLWMTKVL